MEVGGGRGRLYTYRYIVTTRMTSALRWAAMRDILMFQQEVMDKVTRQCSQTTTFLKRKESRSGIEPRSFRLSPYHQAKPAHGGSVPIKQSYEATLSTCHVILHSDITAVQQKGRTHRTEGGLWQSVYREKCNPTFLSYPKKLNVWQHTNRPTCVTRVKSHTIVHDSCAAVEPLCQTVLISAFATFAQGG